MQIAVFIAYKTMLFMLLAVSFYIIYKPSRTFHIVHAFTITLGAYSIYFLHAGLGFNLWGSVFVAVIVSSLFGLLVEVLFYSRLRNGKNAGISMLVLSLGIYVLFQNIVSIFFGDDIKTLSGDQAKEGHQFLGAYITDLQITTILIAIFITAFTLIIWHKTRFGRAIRAISDNPELSQVQGIPKNKIIAMAFMLGSAYAGMAGVLVGFDDGLIPTMGFPLLLYAIIAMIIGGMNSIGGIAVAALILAMTQTLTAYYVDSNWSDVVAYGILIVVLIFRPFGISDAKIRKVEI